MFQGLQICRILKSAGHRVILADLRKFRFSAARFSNSVDKWVTLPDLDTSLESVESYKVTDCIIVALFEYLQRNVFMCSIYPPVLCTKYSNKRFQSTCYEIAIYPDSSHLF